MRSLVPELFMECNQCLRHKEMMVSPQVLKRFNIPYVKFVQKERDFVINYPGAYHSGFNLGYNCAESTNFATERWINVGKKAKHCTCVSDSVKLDMSLFEDWMNGGKERFEREREEGEAQAQAQKKENGEEKGKGKGRGGSEEPSRTRDINSIWDQLKAATKPRPTPRKGGEDSVGLGGAQASGGKAAEEPQAAAASTCCEQARCADDGPIPKRRRAEEDAKASLERNRNAPPLNAFL